MKINRNMTAVTANDRLLRTEKNLAASIERLSSGYKINKPGDNPAGMAISNKMRSQIAALSQAGDNVADGVSVMQIADGALNEVSACLQRIRELSVQAANEINCLEDRQSIQKEIDQLTKEVDRISTDTEYNTKNLLDGSSDVRVYATPKQATRIAISDSVVVGNYTMDINQVAEHAKVEGLNLTAVPLPNGSMEINDVKIDITSSMSLDDVKAAVIAGLEEADCTVDWATGTIESKRYGTSASIEMSATKDLADALGITGNYDAQTGMVTRVNADGNTVETGKDADVSLPTDPTALEAYGFAKTATVTTDGNRVKVTDFNGFSIDYLLDEKAAVGPLSLEVTDIGAMTIQSGGNQYQTMDVSIPEVSSATLYLDTVDVTVTHGGGRAITTLDEAIATVNAVRSRIGAFQNRLEYAAGSLSETEEDMTSAYSTMIDTDMAEEMVEYTQQNVLQQAATSVLAQANELPDTVLSLLSR